MPGTSNCVVCGKPILLNRAGKRFCSDHCRNIWHGRERADGWKLEPGNATYVRSLAAAVGVGYNEQLNIMINRLRDPDGMQDNYAAIYGRTL